MLVEAARVEAAAVEAVVVSPVTAASDAVLVAAAVVVEVDTEVDWLTDVEDSSVVAARKEAETELVAVAVATEEGPGVAESKRVIDSVAEVMVDFTGASSVESWVRESSVNRSYDQRSTWRIAASDDMAAH